MTKTHFSGHSDGQSVTTGCQALSYTVLSQSSPYLIVSSIHRTLVLRAQSADQQSQHHPGALLGFQILGALPRAPGLQTLECEIQPPVV